MKDQPKSLTPKLRFPEFKEDWCEFPVGTAATEYQAKSTIQDEHEVFTSAQSGLMKQVDYYGEGRITERDNVGFNVIPADYLTYRSRTDNGQFYFNHNTLGITGIISVYYPVFYSVHGSNAFLATLLNRFSASIGTHSVGTSQRVLPISKLLRIRLPMPSPAEQNKIAACLMSLDELLAAERRKLDALQAHMRGLMQQLFPRPGESRPRLRFPEFRDAPEWNVAPFARLYTFLPTNTFSRDQLSYSDGTIKNIHYGDIHTKFAATFRIGQERVPYVAPSTPLGKIKPNAFCREGDMIFADASEDLGDVGKSIEIVQLDGEQVLSGSHTILARRNDDTLAIGFGAYLFKSRDVRAQIEKEAQGTKVMSISPNRLSGINVRYPIDQAEQQRIAACLASLAALIAAQSRKLDGLQAHKKGLLQQLFPSPEGM